MFCLSTDIPCEHLPLPVHVEATGTDEETVKAEFLAGIRAAQEVTAALGTPGQGGK